VFGARRAVDTCAPTESAFFILPSTFFITYAEKALLFAEE
jgi:hypothetical protein